MDGLKQGDALPISLYLQHNITLEGVMRSDIHTISHRRFGLETTSNSLESVTVVIVPWKHHI